MLGTVERTGALLDLFTAEDPEWGPTAVARALCIAKSQAHELLLSLCSIGLLRRCGKGRYRLGWRALALRNDLLRSEFNQAASRCFRELVGAVDVATELVVLDRDRILTIAGHRSEPRPARAVGDLHATATGKILLSFLEPFAVDAMTPPDGWLAFTASTITSSTRLAEELACVRERGMAFEAGELGPDRWGAAAPVSGLSGGLTAALGVATDKRTWIAREWALTRALLGTAAKISRACHLHEQAELVA